MPSDRAELLNRAARVSIILGSLGSWSVVVFYFCLSKYKRNARHRLVTWLAVSEIITIALIAPGIFYHHTESIRWLCVLQVSLSFPPSSYAKLQASHLIHALQ